jgi:two-component system NtrC family sensor kinase
VLLRLEGAAEENGVTHVPTSDYNLPIVEAQFRALLQSVESGVLVCDAAGRPVLANERLGQLLGLPSGALADLDRLESRLAGLAANFRQPQAFGSQWRERLRTGEKAAWEDLEMVRPSRKVIERYSRPIRDAERQRAGWLEVYRDITGQRLVHSKMVQTEKMAAIGQLVSGIAHELNNPLTSIMGYAQLLLGRGLSAERAAEAQKIYDEAERAGRIVKNLLLFAREARAVREPANLNELVERTLALRSYELKVENIAVELELDPTLPLTLADSTQMQQVILNLVVNAEQAIQQGRGSGHIRVRTGRRGADRLALEISDDGPGIPPELAPRVFDPFFTTKEVGVGTGLGLSIVYGIVHEHGGEIFLESELGHGAKFTIELPVLREETSGASEREPAPSSFPAEQSLPRLRRPAALHGRVLVVEDEPTVAQLIADVLREEGHLVETALDSREALARIAHGKYDLLICDFRMPHLDGQGFYRALVQAGSPLQHHMVIVTGDTLAPHTLEFLERSGLPYVAKPFLVEEFKLAVERALAGGAAAARVPPGSRAPAWRGDSVRRT